MSIPYRGDQDELHPNFAGGERAIHRKTGRAVIVAWVRGDEVGCFFDGAQSATFFVHADELKRVAA